MKCKMENCLYQIFCNDVLHLSFWIFHSQRKTSCAESHDPNYDLFFYSFTADEFLSSTTFLPCIYLSNPSCSNQLCTGRVSAVWINFVNWRGENLRQRGRREKNFSPRVNSWKSSIERRKERNSRQGGNCELYMVIKLERYRTTMPQRILLHHVACSCRIHADFLSRYLALIIHCHFDIKQTDHQNLECRKTKLIFFKQKSLVCRSTTYLRSLHWNLKPEFQQNCNPMPHIQIPWIVCGTYKGNPNQLRRRRRSQDGWKSV